MEKYQEEKYCFEKIREHIYPWVKESLKDNLASNGKIITTENAPVISFVGGLMIVFAIKRGEDSYEILKDDMLPPKTDIEKLYHIACKNLVRDVEFVFSNTMYGGFGVLADGVHEASALCLRHIWEVCTDKLKDDVVIMVPSKDLVLFVPEQDKKALKQMIDFGNEGWKRSEHKVSKKLFRFSGTKKELTEYI
mgnify:CR=1 FL=1|nr:hypothetical protein [uncultured Sellimonas sp.]